MEPVIEVSAATSRPCRRLSRHSPLAPITESVLHGVRRWAARGLFCLARGILRRAINLHRRRLMSSSQVRLILSMTGVLERSSLMLLLRCRQHRHRGASTTGYEQ